MTHRIIKRRIRPPSAPVLAAALTVDQTSLDVVLQSDSMGTLPIATYTLERTLDQVTWTQIAAGLGIFGPDMIYPDRGLLPERTYYYRCRASDTSGRVSNYGYTSGYTSVAQNAAPVWQEGWTLSIQQGASQSVAAYASDPNGDNLTFYRGAGGNAPLKVTVSLSGVVQVPADMPAGSYTIELVASDGQATDSITVPLAVTATNDTYIVNTRFAGLSLIMDWNDPTTARGYYLNGTDSVTGQQFNRNYPTLWGQTTNQEFWIGITQGRGVTLDQEWTTELKSGVNGPGGTNNESTFRVQRNVVDVSVSEQAPFRLRSFDTPGTDYRNATMLYQRIKLRFAPGFAPTQGGMVLMECKIGDYGAHDKMELLLQHTDGGLCLNLRTIKSSGANPYTYPWTTSQYQTTENYWNIANRETWVYPSGSTCQIFSRNPHELAYPRGDARNLANVTSLDFSKWWTIEWAYRASSRIQNICAGGGTGADGWLWLATSVGTSAQAAPNGSNRFDDPTRNQRFYIRGPTVDDSAITPNGHHYGNHYTYVSGMEITGKYLEYGSLELLDHWPADASPHPASAV